MRVVWSLSFREFAILGRWRGLTEKIRLGAQACKTCIVVGNTMYDD